MCRLYGKLDDVTERNSLVLEKGGKSMRKEKKKMSIKRRIAAAALAAEAPAPVAPAAEEPTPEPIVVEEPTIEEAPVQKIFGLQLKRYCIRAEESYISKSAEIFQRFGQNNPHGGLSLILLSQG